VLFQLSTAKPMLIMALFPFANRALLIIDLLILCVSLLHQWIRIAS
jgi:hypothetical protein